MPFADLIVVIQEDGRIAEQGTFETLSSGNGFVSKLLLNPSLITSDSRSHAGPTDICEEVKAEVVTRKDIPAVTTNDAEGVTRRTGDFAVYKYYLKSIGWKIASATIASCFVIAVSQAFPRKRIQIYVMLRDAYLSLLAIWLNLYSNRTISNLSLFAIIYAIAAVLTLGAVTTTQWFVFYCPFCFPS